MFFFHPTPFNIYWVVCYCKYIEILMHADSHKLLGGYWYDIVDNFL